MSSLVLYEGSYYGWRITTIWNKGWHGGHFTWQIERGGGGRVYDSRDMGMYYGRYGSERNARAAARRYVKAHWRDL